MNNMNFTDKLDCLGNKIYLGDILYMERVPKRTFLVEHDHEGFYISENTTRKHNGYFLTETRISDSRLIRRS